MLYESKSNESVPRLLAGIVGVISKAWGSFHHQDEHKQRRMIRNTMNIAFPCMYTTVQKVLGRFEISKDVYVKSFKQHAFDPLLSNKTTDYYHEVLYLKKYKTKGEVLHKLISIFCKV